MILALAFGVAGMFCLLYGIERVSHGRRTPAELALLAGGPALIIVSLLTPFLAT